MTSLFEDEFGAVLAQLEEGSFPICPTQSSLMESYEYSVDAYETVLFCRAKRQDFSSAFNFWMCVEQSFMNDDILIGLLGYMHRTRFTHVSENEFYDSFERYNFFGCVPCDKLPLDEDFHHAVELTNDLTGDISIVAEFT